MAKKRKGDGQTALITGASGGIGLELARLFAKDGYNLVLAARSADLLERNAAGLAKEFRVSALAIACDLTRAGAGTELVKTLDGRGIAIDVLVNNAGYGVAGPFTDNDLSEQLGMVDLNMRALVELTALLWPRIASSGQGGVLNVASLGAFAPGPFMAVYCATKAFVLSFTEALWDEARGTKVHVTCLCPGPTATGFSARSRTETTRMFRSGVLSSRRVARVGYRAFRHNRRTVVVGIVNSLMAWSTGFSPRGLVLRLSRRIIQSPAAVKE